MMPLEQSGQTLSLLGTPRYKGNSTHNGTKLLLHSFEFTTGFSTLTTAVGVPAEPGFGVFKDPANKNNAITTVKPAGGIPAGVLVRNPAIASGYPAAPNEINDYNKADRMIEGFLEYSTGYDAADDLTQTIADITEGMLLCINDLNGHPHFAAAVPVGYTQMGKVVMVNPDTRKWTVKVSF